MPQQSQTEDGRRRRGDASRETALVAAVRIAEAEGLEALSFGRVATEAGMVKSSLQTLFGDREQLQLQTLAASVAAFGARVTAAVQGSRIGADRPLLRLCVAWFDAVTAQDGTGCLLTGALSDYRGQRGPIPDKIAELQQLWIDALRRAADAGLASGELGSSTDLDLLIFELMAFQGAANTAAFAAEPSRLALARAAVLNRLQRAKGSPPAA